MKKLPEGFWWDFTVSTQGGVAIAIKQRTSGFPKLYRECSADDAAQTVEEMYEELLSQIREIEKSREMVSQLYDSWVGEP